MENDNTELKYPFVEMDIKTLKKELQLSNKMIAEFFGLKLSTFANSSAKKRYEEALCKFYDHTKKIN